MSSFNKISVFMFNCVEEHEDTKFDEGYHWMSWIA